jgi:hypothetical protein
VQESQTLESHIAGTQKRCAFIFDQSYAVVEEVEDNLALLIQIIIERDEDKHAIGSICRGIGYEICILYFTQNSLQNNLSILIHFGNGFVACSKVTGNK